jgi:hypothetical protein
MTTERSGRRHGRLLPLFSVATQDSPCRRPRDERKWRLQHGWEVAWLGDGHTTFPQPRHYFAVLPSSVCSGVDGQPRERHVWTSDETTDLTRCTRLATAERWVCGCVGVWVCVGVCGLEVKVDVRVCGLEVEGRGV